MASKRSGQVVVIGGGIGGLSAAIRLAVAGRPVTLLEQNATVGGKMGEIVQDGFRWDTGPSVITMRHVFEELFAAAGRTLDDYLTLLPVEPLTRYFFPGGEQAEMRATKTHRDTPRLTFPDDDVRTAAQLLLIALDAHAAIEGDHVEAGAG